MTGALVSLLHAGLVFHHKATVQPTISKPALCRILTSLESLEPLRWPVRSFAIHHADDSSLVCSHPQKEIERMERVAGYVDLVNGQW